MERALYHLQNYFNPKGRMGRFNFLLVNLAWLGGYLWAVWLLLPVQEMFTLMEKAAHEGVPYYPAPGQRMVSGFLVLLRFWPVLKRLKDMNVKRLDAWLVFLFVPDVLFTLLSEGALFTVGVPLGLWNMATLFAMIYLFFAPGSAGKNRYGKEDR